MRPCFGPLMISQIAQPDAHVVMKVIRYSDRKANAQDGVSDAKRIDISVAQKKNAATHAPYKCRQSEDGIRNVGDGEQQRYREYRPPSARR